jgi:hypothetical protein
MYSEKNFAEKKNTEYSQILFGKTEVETRIVFLVSSCIIKNKFGEKRE